MSGEVYSLRQFGAMITDEIRMDAYMGALRSAITPGCTVLDIGTGPGTTAMLAIRMGAGHVYALDPDPSVRLAKLAVARNGMADSITVVEGISTEFTPPEPVDVIVCDLRDHLPMNGPIIASIVDARSRLLKPGGTLIPERDTMYAAPVDHPDAHFRVVGPWQPDLYDLDMTDVLDRVVHTREMQRAPADSVIAPGKAWATWDYRTVTDPSISGSVEWVIADPAVAHGLEVWFDAEIGNGYGFSNAPDAPDLVYGSQFLPFPSPIEFAPGDELRCRIDANHAAGDYLLRWRTEVVRGDEVVRSHDQSDFRASLDDPRTTLARQLPSHVPTLGPGGRATIVVLDAFGEGCDVETAAARLRAADIAGYAEAAKAFAFAASLSAEYSTFTP